MLPLARYILAHKAGGGRATHDDFDRLALADRAVNGARKTLAHGRGNVDADNRSAQSESEVRAVAAQFLELELREMGFQHGPDPTASVYATLAMAAKVFDAGVCDNYASVAALSYGKLAIESSRSSQEEVRMVSCGSHAWAEVSGPDQDAVPVVMDPWSEGHAVFAEDSRFGKNREQVETHTSFNIERAAEYHEWSEEFAAGFRSQTWQRLDQAEETLAQMSPRNHPIPEPVLEDGFADRVQDGLQSSDPWKSVVTEVRAVGVAATFGGRGVGSLLADAKTIVRETTNSVTRDSKEAPEPNPRSESL
ncbi:hypothetical protein [Trinickia acidisoli]|uniref:hypothetical protein n=1 Tax=Trinickia acidisoli TaxID=2767482 RepID=UPI001A8FB54D|nr:hypothetical protein [Trinickia acidisoli]